MAAACALGMDISLPSGPFGAPLTSEQTSVPFLFSQCFTTTIVLPGQLYGTFNCRAGGCCALTETEARAPNSAFVKRFLFICRWNWSTLRGNIRNLSITGIFKVWSIHPCESPILRGKVGQRQASAALLNVDGRPAQSKPGARFWTSVGNS